MKVHIFKEQKGCSLRESTLRKLMGNSNRVGWQVSLLGSSGMC